jgi:hypothetical protein
MSLVRVVPLKEFLTSALSTTANGTAFQAGPLSTGQRLYAGLHLTSVSTGRALAVKVQSATSSSFGSPTDQFTFALSSARGSTWGTPLSNLSTDHAWFRASWTLSTAGGSTAGSWTGLVYMGVK